MSHTIGFLGGGRITSIFLKAWSTAKLELGPIVVSDQNPTVLDRLYTEHPNLEITSDNSRPMVQEIVFLALHPPALRSALPEAALALNPDSTVVSLAPILKFSELSQLLKDHHRLVRMIPNAPSLLGKGYNPMAFGPASIPEDRRRLAALLAALGQCPEVPESQLEAFAVLTAMGPTYFWFQWQALRELGQRFGLEAESTNRALHAMIQGASELFFNADLSPESVMDTVPVKPLAEAQEAILAPFLERLPAIHSRLTAQ